MVLSETILIGAYTSGHTVNANCLFMPIHRLSWLIFMGRLWLTTLPLISGNRLLNEINGVKVIRKTRVVSNMPPIGV